MFNRRGRNGISHNEQVNAISQHGDDAKRDRRDMSISASAYVLTSEALRKEGWSDKDAHGALVSAAASYSARIVLAELQHAGLLPDEISSEAHIEAHKAVWDRLVIPHPEPMSVELQQQLLDILDPAKPFPPR